MKYIFETEDSEEAKNIFVAGEMSAGIWEMYNVIRSKYKHGDYKHEETFKEVEDIKQQFFEILGKYLTE